MNEEKKIEEVPAGTNAPASATPDNDADELREFEDLIKSLADERSDQSTTIDVVEVMTFKTWLEQGVKEHE